MNIYLKKQIFRREVRKFVITGSNGNSNLSYSNLNSNIQLKSFTSKIDYSFDTRDFLNKVNDYESKINDSNTPINPNTNNTDTSNLSGYATEEGTTKYSNRNKSEVHSEHFRNLYYTNLKVSSIGLGTYVGAPDDLTDFYMYNAVKSVVQSGGVNCIDTAINYRYMKSERAVGKAIKTLCSKYDYDRSEFIICSKIGYVPEDADNGKRSHSFVQSLVEENRISVEDVIFDDKKRPVHCMHPEFLREQLNVSLRNLELNTLDILYLHNVVESQAALLPPEMFEERLAKAFEFLESARVENKIKTYGLATWNSFRTQSNNPGLHCNLQEVVKLAVKVGGKDHGFRTIQVPVNIMNSEAFVEKYQNFTDKEKGVVPVTLTAACSALQINLISSSPLMQGYMINLPLENSLFNVKNNAAKHLQLIRSIPAECLKSTLVGMKAAGNIKTNLEVIGKPPLASTQFYEILAPKKRVPFAEKEADYK